MVATPPTPRERTREDVRRQIGELSREFQSQRGRLSEPPAEAKTIDRMHRTISAATIRLERLEHEAAAILAEITRLEDEVHGREKALALLLGTVVERIGHSFRDAWSPVPVLGYRLWAMRRGRLEGARNHWRLPSYVASCSAYGGETPHSDGRCGRLGCGVYATKSLGGLLDMHVDAASHSYVAALVALTGKVVEHEHGYRAAAASVTAAYAVWPDRVMATADMERITALFAACDRIPSAWCVPRREKSSPLPDLTQFLTTRAEEEAAWI